MFRKKCEIMKGFVKSDPKTYQYATLHLKENGNLAMFSSWARWFIFFNK